MKMKMIKVKTWGLLLFALMIGQQAIADDTDDTGYTYVEEMPEFPGGYKAMTAYIAKNLRYPDAARADGIEGKVYVRFVVTKTGEISNVEVQRSVHPLLDAEAVRVVKTMPKWIPGKQNRRNVDVYFSVPVAFKLTE